MPAGFDLEDRLGDDLGPAVTVAGSQLGQRREDIELGQDGPRLDQPGGFGRNPVAQGGEELVFKFAGAVLGVTDLALRTP